MEATGKSKERVIKESDKMIQKLRNTDVNFVDEIEDGAGALYTAGIGKTNPRVTVWKAPNKKHGESLLSHEIKHASSEAAILKDPLFEVFNSSYKKYPKLSVSNKWYDNPTLAISEKAYYNDPREQQVIARRIMDIIENEQGIKRGTKITRGNFDVLRNSLNTQNKAKDTHNADIMSMLQQFKHKFGQTEYIDKTIDFINKAYSNPVITIPTVGAIGLGANEINK